ncbi:MAG: undecaprenyl/decaprenyl-phosphate alpha-N-acetylglucosaminyl 1-phosphate transferase [Cyclobacteriaceae bacterium]|nr:undecaprenyl/decaprenyl-phosphate alpha-N-acetylglucosaminyl 1-phosphate transferase [Cyclobacteriaceae bacterium]
MLSVTQIIIFSFIAFLISFLLFPVFIKIFKQLKWYDSPGTHKIHSDFVPSMGGVSILAGASFALLIGLPLQQWITLKYFFISVALMFLIGLRDDVLALSPRQKLFSQFLPVFVLVFLDRVILNSFYDLIPDSQLPLPLAYFITLFTVIIITNAYNLIDGIDGLAGTIGFLGMLFFGVWFYLAGYTSLSIISLCFGGALLAFLFFNWQPSSIFMGDTGALTVGLVLSYFAIRFINYNFLLPEGHLVKFNASISTAICVLIIPIFDTLRVIILRLRIMQSPFHADRNHLHHRLLAFGLSHASAVKWIAGINLSFIIIALLLKSQPDWVLLPIAVLICLIISFVLKRKQQTILNSFNNA